MRKRIALILAVAMLFSMIVPMSASAASDNTIDRVPTVSDDRKFQFGDTDVPNLIIEERAGTTFETEQFRLNLTNAEFLMDEYDADPDVAASEVTRRTDTSVTVLIDVSTSNLADAEGNIIIPLYTEIQGEGEARVTIDPLSSRLSGQTLTFAVGAEGDTVATVDSKETVRRGVNQTGGTILIDETTAGALTGQQEFRLRLPRDFKWNAATEVDFSEWGGPVLTSADDEMSIDGNNGRDLVVKINVSGLESTTRSTIFVRTSIDVSRDANFGDVAVSLTGIRGNVSDASNLVIAEYEDFGIDIDVEEDGNLEFFAGRWDEDYTVEITLEETIEGSFLANRLIDFELPDWVWITDISWNEDVVGSNIDFDFEEGDNSFFYDIGNTDPSELEFELTITIEGDAAVDGPVNIPMTISGAGVAETEVYIGIAKPSVMIEAAEQVAPIEAGLQRQAAPEITITETEAAAIREGDLVVFMRDYFSDSMRVDSFDWEVVEGDIEIDDDSTAGGNLTLEIGAESEEASTIRLYNIEVTLDRTVPMGWFRADVGGDAVVDNFDSYIEDEHGSDIRTDFKSRVKRFNYVEVGTPIGPVVDEKATVAFTVGQNSYMVDGEMMAMDVAPFIADDRLMVPVRYLEALFGMQPIWNPNARTVTVMYEDKVYEMTIGSQMLNVNGAPFLEMDAAAQIVNDRTFVPASRFARAMNIPYTWDAVTQTATFN